MTPRPARSPFGAGLALLLAVGAVAAAAFLLLREPDAGDAGEAGPADAPEPRAPSVGPATPRERGTASRPTVPPGREAPWSAEEDLSGARAPERFVESPIVIESPGRDDDHAVRETGERLRTAFLAVPGLLLRWQGEDAKRRFLESSFRLPPDVAAADGARGAPLAVVVQMLDESEAFSASLSPPVLRIGFEGWTPR